MEELSTVFGEWKKNSHLGSRGKISSQLGYGVVLHGLKVCYSISQREKQQASWLGLKLR